MTGVVRISDDRESLPTEVDSHSVTRSHADSDAGAVTEIRAGFIGGVGSKRIAIIDFLVPTEKSDDRCVSTSLRHRPWAFSEQPR